MVGYRAKSAVINLELSGDWRFDGFFIQPRPNLGRIVRTIREAGIPRITANMQLELDLDTEAEEEAVRTMKTKAEGLMRLLSLAQRRFITFWESQFEKEGKTICTEWTALVPRPSWRSPLLVFEEEMRGYAERALPIYENLDLHRREVIDWVIGWYVDILDLPDTRVAMEPQYLGFWIAFETLVYAFSEDSERELMQPEPYEELKRDIDCLLERRGDSESVKRSIGSRLERNERGIVHIARNVLGRKGICTNDSLLGRLNDLRVHIVHGKVPIPVAKLEEYSPKLIQLLELLTCNLLGTDLRRTKSSQYSW